MCPIEYELRGVERGFCIDDTKQVIGFTTLISRGSRNYVVISDNRVMDVNAQIQVEYNINTREGFTKYRLYSGMMAFKVGESIMTLKAVDNNLKFIRKRPIKLPINKNR